MFHVQIFDGMLESANAQFSQKISDKAVSLRLTVPGDVYLERQKRHPSLCIVLERFPVTIYLGFGTCTTVKNYDHLPPYIRK